MRRSATSRTSFQSTHPVRGATVAQRLVGRPVGISIHAPREGCDPVVLVAVLPVLTFQSTHPVRGATVGVVGGGGCMFISIHAPREGCDVSPRPPLAAPRNFNPRTP